MSTFLLFFIPLITPFIVLFVGLIFLAFEIKMITEVVHNHDLSRFEKALWCLFMIPLLPVTAIAYYFVTQYHHHTPTYI